MSKMEALTVGDPFDEKTELGPLASADGVADLHHDVQKTIGMGARVLTGGKPLDRPGNFYAPTVLTNISEQSPAYREELFGPVASVFRAKDLNHAIQIANASRFGLGASAWTNDHMERERLINDIDAGMVHGLNYPRGILAWADQIGLDHLLSVLDALFLERGEERYRIAPLLRQLGWSGRLGVQTGAGFFSYEED